MRLATICILALSPVLGQDFRATITGEITDKTGAAIAGAKSIRKGVRDRLRQ